MKKKRNETNYAKIGVIFIISALALAGIGVGYSAWTDTITITGMVSTGSVEWEVIEYSGTYVWKVYGADDTGYGPETVVTGDPGYSVPLEEGFRVACAEAMPGAGEFDVDVIFDNLFPCIDFVADIEITYTGTVPGKINDITFEIPVGYEWINELVLSGDIYATARCNGEVVELGYQLHKDDVILIELHVHIPQQQDLMSRSGSFTAIFEVIQWNEYDVPPNVPPVADANGPYIVIEGGTVTLDGSGSYDIDGSIVLYEWDFDGDGTYDWIGDSTTLGITNHTYTTPGTYNAKLRVADDDTAIDTDTATVTVTPVIEADAYVDDDNIDGPWDGTFEHPYQFIQDAIDAVTSSTVFVYSGIYYENITVDKTVDLIGEDKETTIIDGNGTGNVLSVAADWVNISGFTIRNSETVWSGIGIRSKYNTISGNIISNNYFGVSASHSHNTISNNTISMNTRIGIWIYSPSEYNTISNNTISFNNGNRGIILLSSSNNLIYNNYFNNANNACDNGNNIWNIAPTLGLNIIGGDWLGGNHWNDYTGSDSYHGPNQDILGSDGIGDTPYDVPDGANQDLYPLVYPE